MTETLTLTFQRTPPKTQFTMPPKQKRHSPLHDPPLADSEKDQEHTHEEEEDDDEDEEGATASSDEQEEEEDDDEENYRLSRAAQPTPKNPPSQPKPSSSSDSESATESDSDSEPDSPAPNPKVKPLASKPKEQAPKVKPQSSSSTAMQAKSPLKRPAENNRHSNDPKLAKKKKVAEDASASDEEDTKKSSRDDPKKLFQRVFSEQDVVTILEGMIGFRSATGGDDPYKCAVAFHDFMKKRSKQLSFDASAGQLKEKIRRLKTKYQNIARRGKNRFSKPHEQRALELSQVFWGGAEGGASNGAVENAKPDDGKAGKGTPNPNKEIIIENAEKPKPKPKPKAKAKPNSELQLALADSKEFGKIDVRPETSVALGSVIKYDKGLDEYALGEDFLRKGNESMEASKRAEFEGKWRKLEAAELDLRVKRAELYANQAKSMLQAIKSSKN